MKAIHVRMEGFSAFFRLPTVISGTQISSPLPPYSTLLGLIGCCAGRIVRWDETRIGYEYSKRGITFELERTNRFELNFANGKLKPNAKGQGILFREIHICPILDLYVGNVELGEIFKKPIGTPSLGRSQDIVWITLVEEVELYNEEAGMLGPTLLPFPQNDFGGRVVRLADCFEYPATNSLRKLAKSNIYQAVPEVKNGIWVKANSLFHVSNLPAGRVIYLHEWQ